MVSAALWLTLHAAGVDAALTGVVLALLLPTRPTPTASVLLAQAATALAALEHAETEAKAVGERTPLRSSSFPSGTGRAAICRRRALGCSRPPIGSSSPSVPWSTYVVLPLFAFSAVGVPLSIDLSHPGASRVLLGVIVLGSCSASRSAYRSRPGSPSDRSSRSPPTASP